jgi:hypothetical protein
LTAKLTASGPEVQDFHDRFMVVRRSAARGPTGGEA